MENSKNEFTERPETRFLTQAERLVAAYREVENFKLPNVFNSVTEPVMDAARKARRRQKSIIEHELMRCALEFVNTRRYNQSLHDRQS